MKFEYWSCREIKNISLGHQKLRSSGIKSLWGLFKDLGDLIGQFIFIMIIIKIVLLSSAISILSTNLIILEEFSTFHSERGHVLLLCNTFSEYILLYNLFSVFLISITLNYKIILNQKN